MVECYSPSLLSKLISLLVSRKDVEVDDLVLRNLYHCLGSSDSSVVSYFWIGLLEVAVPLFALINAKEISVGGMCFLISFPC